MLVAKEFKDISELYDLEEGDRLRDLSNQDITVERHGEYTESIAQRIRNRVDEELRKYNEFRSSYMMQVLNYLDYFWDGLFSTGKRVLIRLTIAWLNVLSVRSPQNENVRSTSAAMKV